MEFKTNRHHKLKSKKVSVVLKNRWKVFSNCKIWFLEYFPLPFQLIVKSNTFLTFEAGQDLLCCRYYINVWKTCTFKWSMVLTRIANHFLSFKSYEFLLQCKNQKSCQCLAKECNAFLKCGCSVTLPRYYRLLM